MPDCGRQVPPRFTLSRHAVVPCVGCRRFAEQTLGLDVFLRQASSISSGGMVFQLASPSDWPMRRAAMTSPIRIKGSTD